MFMETASSEIAIVDGTPQIIGGAIVSILAFFTILFGIYWEPVLRVISNIY